MTSEQNARYRDILIEPVKKCACYAPKFGHSKSVGHTLRDFQALYGSDPFYKCLGLDSPLLYSAHKTAGGITSIYRQIGIGCERLVRAVFADCLGLTADDVRWSYSIAGANGKSRTLYLDGRIILDKISDSAAKERCTAWMANAANKLSLAPPVRNAIGGIVFEVRQGYKSKDSKRQNADIANAANAYANAYIPCLMVMSAQIDEDIAERYRDAKWVLLRGIADSSPDVSTFSFFEQVIGFDFMQFMKSNQEFFRSQILLVLEKLMSAE